MSHRLLETISRDLLKAQREADIAKDKVTRLMNEYIDALEAQKKIAVP